MKTIYYYQTFCGLHKLLTHVQDIDVINISSIHFDEDKHNNKSIYYQVIYNGTPSKFVLEMKKNGIEVTKQNQTWKVQ